MSFKSFLLTLLTNQPKVMQRSEIISRSMEMFVHEGIKSVRMNDIAMQLGVSKRTLYEQFTNKDELIFEAMELYFSEKRATWTTFAQRAANVVELLFMVLNHIMEYADTTARLMDTLKRFHPEVYQRVISEGTKMNQNEFRQMLREGIQQGMFIPTFNIDLAINVLYYSASALVTRKIPLPEGIDDNQAFLHIICTFFRGIATAKGMELIDQYTHQYDFNQKTTK